MGAPPTPAVRLGRYLAALLLTAAATVVEAGTAQAAWTARATGNGRVRAITVATPPAPGAVSTFPVLSCSVTVSWPTPPAGVSYSVQRVLFGATTQVQAPTTTAGSITEGFLLSALLGTKPIYVIRASLTAAPAWIRSSAQVTAC